MEFKILYFIQDHLHSPAVDWLMVGLTHLGEFGTIWILLSFVLVCTKKYRRYGILMLCSLLITFTAGEGIIKNIVCRVRPCNMDPSITLLIHRPKSFSFPSGHTASSFTAAWILLKANKKMGIAGFCLAVLIGFSRIYLYVHFPTDVLAGAVLGVMCAQMVYYFYNKKYSFLFAKTKYTEN